MKKIFLAKTTILALLCCMLFPLSVAASSKDSGTSTKDKVSTAIESFFKNTTDKTLKQTYNDWVERFRKKTDDLVLDAEIAFNKTKVSVKLVSSVSEWKTALAESIANFEPQVRMLIYKFDQKKYASESYLKNMESLQSYGMSFTTLQDIAYMEYNLTYKQGYVIVNAYENDTQAQLSKNDKAVYDKAQAIIKEVIRPKMTDYEKELAIHDYLVNNSEYDKTLKKFTPYDLLINKTGVCEAYAQSMMILMRMVDIPCIIVTGTSNGVSHAWNIVTIDEKDYEVDVTWNDPISKTPVLSYAYFNLTTAQMGKDHKRSTQSKDAPICTATDANYFVVNKLTANTASDATALILSAKNKGLKSIELFSANMTANFARTALKEANVQCTYSVNGNVLRVTFE